MTVTVYRGLYLDFDSNIVRRNGKDLKLTDLEYRLLCYLMSNIGKILVTTWIIDKIWPNYGKVDKETEIHALHTAISRLRKKIGPDVITTRRGIGYGILP